MLESNTLLVYPCTTPARAFIFSMNINKYFRADFLLQVVCPKLLKKSLKRICKGRCCRSINLSPEKAEARMSQVPDLWKLCRQWLNIFPLLVTNSSLRKCRLPLKQNIRNHRWKNDHFRYLRATKPPNHDINAGEKHRLELPKEALGGSRRTERIRKPPCFSMPHLDFNPVFAFEFFSSASWVHTSSVM